MNFAIILSGGTGQRLGRNIPKQYIEVNEKPIFTYCLKEFEDNEQIDKIVICACNEWLDFINSKLVEYGIKKEIVFSTPGQTRQMTIYNALKKCSELSDSSQDVVIIHDSVRPFITRQLIDDCLQGCKNYDAAIACIEVKDTIYQSDNGEFITEVPMRSKLFSGQTPEAFNLKQYLAIHDNCTEEQINAVTGGAEFAYRKGMRVHTTKGSEANIKITTEQDLQKFIDICNSQM